MPAIDPAVGYARVAGCQGLGDVRLNMGIWHGHDHLGSI